MKRLRAVLMALALLTLTAAWMLPALTQSSTTTPSSTATPGNTPAQSTSAAHGKNNNRHIVPYPANADLDHKWLGILHNAIDHCYLNGTAPGQRVDIVLNADQILIDIGAERMASGLAKGYEIEYRWNGWEWKDRDPQCDKVWEIWGPRGYNWLKRGDINAEWLAQQDLKQTLTNREKELKTAPAQ
jgi:hypothetical protein